MDDNEQQEKEQPDVSEVYANNSRFELSVWDLKVIFGQLDQFSGDARIDWHTAVTVPWGAAKIASYYLQLNILAHEAENGRIRIPPRVFPTPPPAPTGEFENDPKAIRLHEQATELWREFKRENEEP